jgi:hypothetical protein
MLFARQNPVDIDIPIAGLQKFLYSQVKLAWNITDDFKYDCYDRSYRDLVDKGYVPRYLITNAQGVLEYKTLGFDPETNWAISFFHVGDQVKEVENRTSRSQVALIFAVNLGTPAIPTVKPLITDHRPDAEVRNDIERICYTPWFNFELTSIETGIETVFREYKGFLDQDRKEFLDWQPLHVFRLNFDLIYGLEDCTNEVPNLI